MPHQPPQLARKILRWFVHAEFVEEVEGDLEEIFFERLSNQHVYVAKLHYFLDVIRAIRPYHQKRKPTAIAHEIINGIFLRLALRTLAKRKAYSFINILGLSTGLVSFFFIMEYVAFERSYDSFHSNASKIYRVAFDWGETDYKGENSSIYASSVPALGPAILETLSEVEAFTRFVPVLTVKPYCVFSCYQDGALTYTGNADHGFYADSSFLKIFSFPTVKGGIDPLSKPHSIVITRSFATKMYGDVSYDKIIGSFIEVDAPGKQEHLVTAILEDIPTNSHIQFDYLISYSTINSGRLEGNLGWSQFYTYIMSNHPLADEWITPKFKKLVEKLYGTESHISIFLQPLEEIYLTSKLREEVGESGSAQQLIFLTIIAYIILFMAWINYINMFLARSMERVNEIGVKKVLGSTRAHLIVQFFTESLVINVVSISFAILLWITVQRPFEIWIGKEVSGVLLSNLQFIVFVLLGVVAGSIVAGLYPALILSSQQTVQVLGRKFQASKNGIFFKQGLVYFQFVMSFIIVACTLIINRQIDYMKNAELGIELSGCVAIRSPGTMDSSYQQRLHAFKERLLTYSFIENISFTSTIPGKPINTSGGVQRVLGPDLEGNNVFFLQVDDDFLNTYHIRLIAGKNFSEKVAETPTVILNEAALKTLKFESPEEALNHRIHWQRKEYEVIGVMANYNHLFLKETFEPIMLSYHPSAPGFITLKIQDGYYDQALAVAKEEMQLRFPSAPFEYDFLTSTYDHQYYSIQQFELLAKYFALLAIVIACLGLFALSYYTVQNRIKEVAVRKVFGAGIFDVMLLLSQKYVGIAVISCVVGSIVTFYIMGEWLQNFAFAIRLRPLDFLVPLAAITVLVIGTVSYNCLRTSILNPSHSLKHK